MNILYLFYLSLKMEKHKVKKIYHVDNYTLIRAFVIGIAYRERMKKKRILFKEYHNSG